jgi:D-alanyl-lipoteichoic acid acyltransferase DltB (MBOAT superfamily)
MPQLPHLRATARGWSVGITLLVLGLAKKMLIADSLIPAVSGVFTAAHAGAHITPGEAWLGTLAYTLQLYFDFSGYSDIAIGLGAFFGIALPVNFASPYRATSIIDFWRRWHITLSRFLRNYLYIPLGGSRVSLPRQATVLMITMFLGGLWHGAGWTFVFWGGLHGCYLVVNHLWRKLPKSPLSQHIPLRVKLLSSWALTFLAVMIGLVFFRATTFVDAQRILVAMVGMTSGGFELLRVPGEDVPIIVGAALLAWFAPNSQQILASLKWLPSDDVEAWQPPWESLWAFQPNLRWACWLALLLVCCVMQLSDISEFLYFHF